MSKRSRIKLNLLAKRAWSNLTDLFTSTILQHRPHFFAICQYRSLILFSLQQKSTLLFLLSLSLLLLLSLQLWPQSQNNYCQNPIINLFFNLVVRFHLMSRPPYRCPKINESLFTFYASLTCPHHKSSQGIKCHP